MNEDMAKGIDLTEGIEGKLHAEFDDAKAKVKKADTLVEYYHKPTFRIVINAIKALFPVLGDLFDDNLCTMIEDNQKKNRKLLLDIIFSDEQSITPDMVNDVEFIVNLARVMDAVNRLARNEKVRYFGNLIKNGYLSSSDPKISNDEFEEYFYEISRLSFRELEYLAFFWRFAANHEGEIAAYNWKTFSEEFNEKYSGQDPRAVYRKLIKTGFIYEIKMETFVSEAARELHLDNEGYRIDEGFKRFYEIVLASGTRGEIW